MPDDFESPITELAAMAAMHHELYESYKAAGFTEEQAFTIVLTVIRTGLGDAQ